MNEKPSEEKLIELGEEMEKEAIHRARKIMMNRRYGKLGEKPSPPSTSKPTPSNTVVFLDRSQWVSLMVVVTNQNGDLHRLSLNGQFDELKDFMGWYMRIMGANSTFSLTYLEERMKPFGASLSCALLDASSGCDLERLNLETHMPYCQPHCAPTIRERLTTLGSKATFAENIAVLYVVICGVTCVAFGPWLWLLWKLMVSHP